MGTVIEPPHPHHPVGTVSRAKRDPLPPPHPSQVGRAPLASSVDSLPTWCTLPAGFRFPVPKYPE